MPVVSTMILNSLIMTGEKDISVTSFTQNETSYHLSRLNSMIDSWSNERLMIPYLSQTSFALTASTVSYSIGPGATFNMTRPTQVVNPCFIRDTSNMDSPLEIINMEAYGRLVLKSTSGTYPSYLAYDHGFSATSTATLYVYPGPTSGLTLYINTIQPLGNFSTVTQTLQLPPGYQDAIESNYGMRSALGLIPISNDLREMARATKAAIKSTNMVTPVARLDYGATATRRISILTGP